MMRPKAFLQWAIETFGAAAASPHERNCRFLEEAIEVAHAGCLPRETAERILDRVYSRPAGPISKEIGQALATLECLAENLGLSADAECDREFARVKGIPREDWIRRHDAKVALQIASTSTPASGGVRRGDGGMGENSRHE